MGFFGKKGGDDKEEGLLEAAVDPGSPTHGEDVRAQDEHSQGEEDEGETEREEEEKRLRRGMCGHIVTKGLSILIIVFAAACIFGLGILMANEIKPAGIVSAIHKERHSDTQAKAMYVLSCFSYSWVGFMVIMAEIKFKWFRSRAHFSMYFPGRAAMQLYLGIQVLKQSEALNSLGIEDPIIHTISVAVGWGMFGLGICVLLLYGLAVGKKNSTFRGTTVAIGLAILLFLASATVIPVLAATQGWNSLEEVSVTVTLTLVPTLPPETEEPAFVNVTAAPETEEPTATPDTEVPDTGAPLTPEPSAAVTIPPTDVPSPDTPAPDTEPPETAVPMTEANTVAPTIEPTGSPNVTDSPTNAPDASTTVSPDTPETDIPDTEAPDTVLPEETDAPDTETPVNATEAPLTAAPDTPLPTTDAPETAAPPTEVPSTATPAPPTDAPPTQPPATPAPPTEAPPTPAPTCWQGEYNVDATCTGTFDTDIKNTTDVTLTHCACLCSNEPLCRYFLYHTGSDNELSVCIRTGSCIVQDADEGAVSYMIGHIPAPETEEDEEDGGMGGGAAFAIVFVVIVLCCCACIWWKLKTQEEIRRGKMRLSDVTIDTWSDCSDDEVELELDVLEDEMQFDASCPVCYHPVATHDRECRSCSRSLSPAPDTSNHYLYLTKVAFSSVKKSVQAIAV